MFTQKYILWFCILVFAGTSCAPTVQPVALSPTAQPEPIATSIQQQPISTVFIGIPPISNPLIRAEDESVEEFVARIAATDISYGQPVLIALTQLESKESLSFGVPSDMWDIQKCWIYEKSLTRVCTGEDIENYFHGQSAPKIFFAPAYSTSTESLFIPEYFHYWDEQFPMDMYRIVIELKDGNWIEKSILPGFC